MKFSNHILHIRLFLPESRWCNMCGSFANLFFSTGLPGTCFMGAVMAVGGASYAFRQTAAGLAPCRRSKERIVPGGVPFPVPCAFCFCFVAFAAGVFLLFLFCLFICLFRNLLFPNASQGFSFHLRVWEWTCGRSTLRLSSQSSATVGSVSVKRASKGDFASQF